jgi:hypothetical protein
MTQKKLTGFKVRSLWRERDERYRTTRRRQVPLFSAEEINTIVVNRRFELLHCVDPGNDGEECRREVV